MSRGGRKKLEAGSERRCIATGETADPGLLVRFVVGPGDVIVPDLRHKLPGRGIWVTPTRASLQRAVDRKLFARAAKAPATAPADLADQVEAGLAKSLVETISLARKAGEAVAGFEKVKAWLESGEARVLLQASDGSERGKSKLRSPPGKDVFIGCLTQQELGLAFGRESVIHGALMAGGLSEKVIAEGRRLRGLRKSGGETPVGKEKTTHER